MRTRRTGAAMLTMLAAAAIACGGDDGADDASNPDAPDAGGGTRAVAPPAIPSLTPCPAGWRETVASDGSTPACDPWPTGGIEECAAGEAHFPGEEGCSVVGPPCPTGRYPVGLPTDRTIRYVDGSVAASGDGSPDAPYQRVGDALRNSGTGDVVAVAKGTYDEDLTIRGGVTLWGACAAETQLLSRRGSLTAAVVSVEQADVAIHGVTIGGARPAIFVRDPVGGLLLEGVIIDDAVGAGVGVSDGTLVARDVAFRDTRTDAAGSFGTCVLAQGGASVTLERAVLERCSNAGITASENSTVRVSDSAIRDGQPSPTGFFGRGASFEGGTEAVFERVVIDGNREFGLMVSGEGTRVEATDLLVHNTLPQIDGRYGHGLTAFEGATMTVRRARVTHCHEVGFYAREAGLVTFEDVVIEDTQLQEASSSFGSAMVIGDSPFEMTRTLLASNHHAGVALHGAGTVGTFSDLTVVSTRSVGAGAAFGRGFNAQDGPVVTLSRVRLAENRDVSVFVSAATLLFEDLAIESTLPKACAATTCAASPFGVGVVVVRESIVDLDRFLVADSDLVGIQVADSGELDVRHGEIRNNPIGANVQVPDYDLARLQDDVIYRDNATNLDATDLPVPSPGEPFGET